MVGEVIETGDYRKVPVVGNARLGNGGYYEDLGYPAGHGDGFLDIPSKDPNAFALRVKGNSMAPMIMDGWFVLVEPNGSIEPGEPVLVRKKMARSWSSFLRTGATIRFTSGALGMERWLASRRTKSITSTRLRAYSRHPNTNHLESKSSQIGHKLVFFEKNY